MMIIVKLDEMLYRRRMTLTELFEKIGITLANLSVLKTSLLEFAEASPETSNEAPARVAWKLKTLSKPRLFGEMTGL